ncbi:MAG: serine protein kinase RIO [Dehalococcoidia bacterium]|nr:MAG: serine protein kinase RIO [Dehalococcoidia bacterium]
MDWTITDSLDPFFEQGLIDEVLYTVKSGKEATVVCCRAARATRHELLAAKIYRPRAHRSFKDDSRYREGQVILDARVRRAVASKTSFGRQAAFAIWVDRERDTLTRLRRAGAAVPEVVAAAGGALLLEFIGDAAGAAPMLKHAPLTPDDARRLSRQLLDEIERWLRHNVVHGDLSPFNVLVWHGRAMVIDFPQAVDPRFNVHAFDLLRRDIEQLARFFRRYDIVVDAEAAATDLWVRFVTADL